jgi:hypothetical protein
MSNINRQTIHEPLAPDFTPKGIGLMNANQRYKTLLRSMPRTATDFDIHGILTDEAAKRIADGAWEQLSASERAELEAQYAEQYRLEEAERLLDQLVAEGQAEKAIDAEGKARYRLLDAS